MCLVFACGCCQAFGVDSSAVAAVAALQAAVQGLPRYCMLLMRVLKSTIV
jgi:hypothetical protein